MAEIFTLHPDLQALIDDHFDFVQQLHHQRSLAPLGAIMDLSGGISGAAIVADKEKFAADNSSPDDTVRLLTEQFTAAAQRGEIQASAIFFHGHNTGGPAVLPAEYEAEANCVVAFLDHHDGQAVAAVFNYSKDGTDKWVYAAPAFIRKKPLIFGDAKNS